MTYFVSSPDTHERWGAATRNRRARISWTGIARRLSHAVLLLVLLILSAQVGGGCSCGPAEPPPAHSQGILPCVRFALSPMGEARYSMPLASVPGRAGVESALSLTYDSAGGNGVLGMGFSLSGASAITRCPSNLADDAEIRAVQDDAADKLCLDGKRLIKEGIAPGTVEYRTFPDTLVKVVGHVSHGEDAKEGARTRSRTRRRLAHRSGRASSRRRIRGFEELQAEVRAGMADDLVGQESCAGRSEDDVRRLLRPRGAGPAGGSTSLTAIDPPCRLRSVDGDARDFKEAR